jgi:hypothetical protein
MQGCKGVTPYIPLYSILELFNVRCNLNPTCLVLTQSNKQLRDNRSPSSHSHSYASAVVEPVIRVGRRGLGLDRSRASASYLYIWCKVE